MKMRYGCKPIPQIPIMNLTVEKVTMSWYNKIDSILAQNFNLLNF